MASDYTVMKPWYTGWTPMAKKRPRLRRCPACKSVPLWRHMLRDYWIICTNCGLETAAFPSPEDAAAAWNIGSEETDRVDGERTITHESIDDIVDQAMGGKQNGE